MQLKISQISLSNSLVITCVTYHKKYEIAILDAKQQIKCLNLPNVWKWLRRMKKVRTEKRKQIKTKKQKQNKEQNKLGNLKLNNKTIGWLEFPLS